MSAIYASPTYPLVVVVRADDTLFWVAPIPGGWARRRALPPAATQYVLRSSTRFMPASERLMAGIIGLPHDLGAGGEAGRVP